MAPPAEQPSEETAGDCSHTEARAEARAAAKEDVPVSGGIEPSTGDIPRQAPVAETTDSSFGREGISKAHSLTSIPVKSIA